MPTPATLQGTGQQVARAGCATVGADRAVPCRREAVPSADPAAWAHAGCVEGQEFRGYVPAAWQGHREGSAQLAGLGVNPWLC